MEHVIEVSRDRYEAHVDLSERLLEPGQPRDFQWRFITGKEPVAKIRRDGLIDFLPNEHATISFEIDTIPLKRNKGRRTYLRQHAEQKAFITSFLFSNAGLLIDPDGLSIKPHQVLISNGREKPFYKPSAVFSGQATVMNIEKLAFALLHGIGQGKAYGFGMLEIGEYDNA